MQAAVFDNVNKTTGERFYNACLTRSYKDVNDKWVNETVYLPFASVRNALALLESADRVIARRLEEDAAEAEGQEEAYKEVPEEQTPF